MKFLASYFLFFCIFVFSCTGDCASCHYTIDYKNDKRHAAMLECKTCHTPEKMQSLNMGDTCGEDCFACHNVEKLQKESLKKEHSVIMDSCMQCHKNLAKETLNKSIFMQERLQQNFFNHDLLKTDKHHTAE